MVTAFIQRKQFTIDEYHRMGETGILHEDDRVELIEGEIVSMSPVGLRHMACVNRLNKLFLDLTTTNQTIISIQNPLLLDDYNEPEPDIVLFQYRDDFYETKRPSAADAFLVIEVSDATLAYDQNIKIPLYAQSNVHELWIVDLQTNTLQTYSSPNGKSFQETSHYTIQDMVSPKAFPAHSIPVQALLGVKSNPQ